MEAVRGWKFCAFQGVDEDPFPNIVAFERGSHVGGKDQVVVVSEKVSPHRLRHTSATIAAQGGMNTFQLAEMLGHSDLKTTMIYTHPGGQMLQEAHAKVSPFEKIRESV